MEELASINRIGWRLKYELRLSVIAVVIGLTLFLGAHEFRRPLYTSDMQMSVAAPIPLQLIAAMGDRYAAANIAVWRVLMTGDARLPRESLAALARVQEDASFLNPGHEDNYVTATSLLPWEGFVAETQTILRRATESRNTDYFAPFFYGFNEMQFLSNGKVAYEYGRIAASRAPDKDTREALSVIAAGWLERGNDPLLAEQVISVLAEELRNPQLQELLRLRAKRQQVVQRLQQVVDEYVIRVGRVPRDMAELIESGGISQIPIDPVGTVVFTISTNGRVTFQQIQKK